MSDASTAPTTNVPPPAKKPGTVRLLGRGLLAAILLIAAYLLFWPSPIDPVPYEPPPIPPLVGALAPNEELASAELIAVGKVDGPEDVEVDAQGRIVTGLADGRIVRVDPDGTVNTLVNTDGRPVGIATAPDGNLIVADAVKGLLSITPEGEVTLLANGAGNEPLGFADDVTVARDGTIYFSDASTKFGPNEYLYDMLEGRPHGRLVRYDPSTKTTTVLLPDMCFANGVALSQNEDFLVVNETYRFRILRYWLKGERAGEWDVFADNLPGYPDNITQSGHGTFWLALFTVRNEQADWLSPRPFVKSVMAKLPALLWPKPQPYAFVVQLDEGGKFINSLQDPTGQHLREVTSAFERDGYLYLGSLHNDRIGRYKLPGEAATTP
ncbi:MAG TPA: SMP-30/gluconolactonase/LRE family protein [Pirellulales bacterium]|nr:SMP-30/gluconolactonase/LRE family protein [Pirellulales bacterium]